MSIKYLFKYYDGNDITLELIKYDINGCKYEKYYSVVIRRREMRSEKEMLDIILAFAKNDDCIRELL